MTSTASQIDLPKSFAVQTTKGAKSLAYRARQDAGSGRPGLVWLGGFRSDMQSTKAQRLDDFAKETGRACLRFDYSGHGESGGAFEDGTIGGWCDESLSVVRALTTGPQILIGSSMGGWISLLMARQLAALNETHRLAGMVLIAPAVDFTQSLMWPQMSPAIRAQIENDGQWLRPNAYGEPYPITRGLIEDGRNQLLFGSPIRSYCPVHILQGLKDPDVPYEHTMKLVHHMAGDPVAITLIKDGDHRLSREEDIARLISAVRDLI